MRVFNFIFLILFLSNCAFNTSPRIITNHQKSQKSKNVNSRVIGVVMPREKNVENLELNKKDSDLLNTAILMIHRNDEKSVEIEMVKCHLKDSTVRNTFKSSYRIDYSSLGKICSQIEVLGKTVYSKNLVSDFNLANVIVKGGKEICVEMFNICWEASEHYAYSLGGIFFLISTVLYLYAGSYYIDYLRERNATQEMLKLAKLLYENPLYFVPTLFYLGAIFIIIKDVFSKKEKNIDHDFSNEKPSSINENDEYKAIMEKFKNVDTIEKVNEFLMDEIDIEKDFKLYQLSIRSYIKFYKTYLEHFKLKAQK